MDATKTPKPKVVCAWCTATIEDGDAGPVSHSICSPCKATHFPAAR